MKIWKLISLLLLAAFVGACDDDKVSDEETGGTGNSGTSQVSVVFGYEAKTVLKNTGQVLVPVKLEQAVNNTVKITVDAGKGETATDAREGIDFNLPEKVVTIAAGDTIAYLAVDILDNAKAEAEREIKLNITGVYGGIAGSRKSASIYIVSNAFVEFEKAAWETYESAGTEGSSEAIRNSRFIPLVINGEITESATVVLEVTDSTAVEPVHFTVEKEVTLSAGTTKVNVEIKPIDDDEANDDRVFTLKIKEVKGGNLLIGKTNNQCNVKIISEEVKRTLTFGIKSLDTKDMDRTVRIPVFLDKASENDVVVTVGASALSTAVENKDYVIENKSVSIGSSLRGEVVVKILEDYVENPDRKLIIELKDATEKVAISQTDGTCTVNILNNDWKITPVKSVVVAEEDMGVYSYKARITPVDRERIVKLQYEVGNAAYFLNLPDEATIPAGESEITVDVTIGYTSDYPAVTPELKIKYVECDESVYSVPVVGTIQAEPCAYRKLLGVWTMKTGNPDNCKAQADATITQVTWQKEVKVVLASFWNNQNVYFNMTYDKATRGLSIVLNKRCEDHNWNFGGANTSVGLRLLVDGQYDLVDVAMGGYDVENGILTLPKDKHIGGGGSQGNMTDKPAVWAFFWKNGTLVKQ